MSVQECNNFLGPSLNAGPIQGLALCFDAVPTNIAVLKQLQRMVQAAHEKQAANGDSKTIFPLFPQLCCIHQLALARRACVYSFGGLWASLVRLGHLLESNSFRRQFRRALLQVVVNNFEFVPVPNLPAESSEWKSLRSSHMPRGSSYRSRLFHALAIWDNGDPEARKIHHYCIGSCCSGATLQEKSRYSLLQISKHLTLLFTFGFPIPLLYRWVHASQALEFCKLATFLHRLLPQALAMINKIGDPSSETVDTIEEAMQSAGLFRDSNLATEVFDSVDLSFCRN